MTDKWSQEVGGSEVVGKSYTLKIGGIDHGCIVQTRDYCYVRAKNYH